MIYESEELTVRVVKKCDGKHTRGAFAQVELTRGEGWIPQNAYYNQIFMTEGGPEEAPVGYVFSERTD